MRRIVAAWILAFVALIASAGEPSAVAVFKDRFEPPVRVEIRELSPTSPAGVVAAWIWSENASPQRAEIAGPGARPLKPSGDWLTVKIPPGTSASQHLSLIAGPPQMWEEVPEALLPRFPVEASTRATTVRIPFNASLGWRVRLAGSGVGSWWVDVAPGKRSVTIAPTVAADRILAVHDEKNVPVARVRVSLLSANAARDYQKLADYRTDRKGQAAVQALPDAARLTMVLGADGRAPLVLGDSLPSRLPPTLTIQRGAALLGQLVDRDGHPVAGAKLTVNTFMSQQLPVPLIRSGVSDADGKWTVTALPKGRGEWEVEAAGFATATLGVRIEGAESVDLGTVTLEKAVAVDVRVTDDRGQVIPGATLMIGARTAGTTDSKGTARLQLAARASLNVSVSAIHHLTRTLKLELPLRHQASIVLPRSFRVRGRLTENVGSPASAGHVVVHDEAKFQNFDIGTNGRFSIDLEPDLPYTVEIVSPRTAVTRMDLPKGVSGEIRDLGDIVPPMSRVVTGRVVREDGSAVANARVWLPRPSQYGSLMAFAFNDILEAQSEPTGEFSLRGVPDVPFVVRVEAQSLASVRRTVTPSGNDDISLGEIRLSGGATLTISMDGDRGDDAEARVDTAGHGLPMDQLTGTFFEGRASVPNVPAGAVNVSAWRGRKMLCREETLVPADKQEVDVICTSRRVTVTGRIEVGGKPTGPGTVLFATPMQPDLPTGIMTYGSGDAFQQHVFSPQAERETADVTTEGTYGTAVTAGRWEVYWMPEQGRALGPRQVNIAQASAQEVVLQFPGVSVQGIVLDAERKPVEGAQVHDIRGRGFAMTRGDGTFTLAGPDPGEWRLQASYRGDTSAVATRTVDADHDAPYVELVLDAAKSAIRAVVTRDRQPAGGAIVFLEPSEGGLELVTADVTGTAVFSVREPAPQRVRIAANVAGTWTVSEWMPVDDAVKSGVTLAVGATGTILVRSKAPSGALTIAGSDGWRVDRLLQWLGTFPSLSANSDLAVSGLPPGTYTITLGGNQRTVSVADGKTVETVFE